VKKKAWGSPVEFMADPITDQKVLDENPKAMRTKMELMIMRIQVTRNCTNHAS